MFKIELDAVGSPPQTIHRKLFQVCSEVAPAEFTPRTTNIFDVYAFLMDVLCRSIARQPRHVGQTCSDNKSQYCQVCNYTSLLGIRAGRLLL